MKAFQGGPRKESAFEMYTAFWRLWCWVAPMNFHFHAAHSVYYVDSLFLQCKQLSIVFQSQSSSATERVSCFYLFFFFFFVQLSLLSIDIIFSGTDNLLKPARLSLTVFLATQILCLPWSIGLDSLWVCQVMLVILILKILSYLLSLTGILLYPVSFSLSFNVTALMLYFLVQLLRLLWTFRLLFNN